MTTFYQQNNFNNQNNNNLFNVVKINEAHYNQNSPNPHPTLIVPTNQYINNHNPSPFFLGNLTTVPNYPPGNTYNMNTKPVNQNIYQTSTANFNTKEGRFPRFPSKQPNNNAFANYNYNYLATNPQQMQIQRSNTINYGPRASAVPRVGTNFHFKLDNTTMQPTKRKTISSNFRFGKFSSDSKPMFINDK